MRPDMNAPTLFELKTGHQPAPKISFDKDYIYTLHGKYERSLIDQIIYRCSKSDIKHIVYDGFCGMGGVTAGFSQLQGYYVVACLNHWDVAIDTHKKNFPLCLHLQEDFRTADLDILIYIRDEIKKNNPLVNVHVWLSLECTNFSNAKGGMSRDADSRTLADDSDRYVIALTPDIVWIENVKEFKLWGPMIPKVIAFVKNKKGILKKKTLQYNPDKHNAGLFFNDLIEAGALPQCPLNKDKETGKYGIWLIPEQETKGRDFKRWRAHMCSFGYHAEDRLLNCADYGVPQHRVRLIMQFNRIGIPHSFPKPTHDKKGRNGLPKWKPVRPCLDLEDKGDDVISYRIRKKDGKLVPRISSEKTIDRLIKGVRKHLKKESKDGKLHLIDHYFGNGYMKPISDPAGTTGTKDGIALHTVQFLGTYFSQGDGTPLHKPCSALPTKDKYPLITAQFIDQQYSQGQQNKSIDDTCGSLTTVPKQRVVSVDMVMNTSYNNDCKSIDVPSDTFLASRKHFYLVNFQWCNGNFKTIDQPANTQIARQDKAPNYLFTLETGEVAIEIFEYDPPHYVKLKKFMAEYGIVRMSMRMLYEVEMLKIMTIPPETKLSKSSTDNKKMIGNAVPSDLVVHLGRAYDEKIQSLQKIA